MTLLSIHCMLCEAQAWYSMRSADVQWMSRKINKKNVSNSFMTVILVVAWLQRISLWQCSHESASLWVLFCIPFSVLFTIFMCNPRPSWICVWHVEQRNTFHIISIPWYSIHIFYIKRHVDLPLWKRIKPWWLSVSCCWEITLLLMFKGSASPMRVRNKSRQRV